MYLKNNNNNVDDINNRETKKRNRKNYYRMFSDRVLFRNCQLKLLHF